MRKREKQKLPVQLKNFKYLPGRKLLTLKRERGKGEKKDSFLEDFYCKVTWEQEKLKYIKD